MRVLAAVLAVVALAALGFAPAEAGPDPVCEDECMMPSAGAGFVPPVNVVLSGATVSWSSLDTSHLNVDGTGLGSDAPICFAVGYNPSAPSDGVTLVIDGALLKATVDGVTKVCQNGRGGDQGFILPYYCTLHPTMHGTLVVVP